MDSHSESVAEPTAVEELPDAGEQLSFEASLDAAFARLDEASSGEPEQTEPFDDKAVNKVEQADEAEQPAEPEQPAESEEQEPIESLTEDIGDDWTPKAASRFKQLKTELKSSKSELDMLRQQQQEYESKIKELTGLTESKDLEALQEKLSVYENQQLLNNLEATDAYKEAVTNPLAALVSQAEEIADKYDVDADALVDIMGLQDQQQQDEQLSELLPSATDRDKARLYRIIEDIDPIIARRDNLFQNAEQALAEANALSEKKEMQLAAEKAELRANVTRNVIERVNQKLPFLSGIDGLDMDKVQSQAAESDPSVIHPVDYAYNAVSAQLLPTVVREYVSMRKENELLTDRLAEYEGAEPTVSGQAKPSVGATGVADDMSFEQSIDKLLGGA